METIGGRIRKKRIELGLSVDELSVKLGKNRATVYRYESDEIANFPISVMYPLAKALQTTPAYLMGWGEEIPTTKEGQSESTETHKKRSEIHEILYNIPDDKLDKFKALLESAIDAVT